jgi:uncharacterized protein YdaU (DUF1376 family)
MALPMLPWFPGSFMSSTRGWSVTAKGVYRELLDAQWDLKTLPVDPEELRQLIGATPAEWALGWPKCEPKFPLVDDGRRNARLENHRSESERLRAKRVEAAARTNAQRYGHRDGQQVGERDGERSLSETVTDTASETVTGSSTSTSTSTLLSSSEQPSEDSRPLPRPERPKPAYESREFHERIVNEYRRVLVPALPDVREWEKDRQRLLNERIAERVKAGKPADTSAYWTSYFELVASNDFLLGRGSSRGWRANLEWLLGKKNFRKVLEGTLGTGREARRGH